MQEWESQLKQLWSKGIAYLLEQDKIQTCLDIRIVLTPNEGDIYLVQKNEHRILTATKVKTDTQRMLMDLVSSLTDDEKREQQQRRGNLQSHHRASYFYGFGIFWLYRELCIYWALLLLLLSPWICTSLRP